MTVSVLLAVLPVQSRWSSAVVQTVQADISRLYERWMGLMFPRQTPGSVLGKWRPRTILGRLEYRGWWLLGLPVVVGLYGLALLGTPIRVVTRRTSDIVNRLGPSRSAGILGLFGAVISILAWNQLSHVGFLAIVIAAGLTILAVLAAILGSRLGGRITTVVFVFPLSLLSLTMVPLVTILYSSIDGSLLWQFSANLETLVRPLLSRYILGTSSGVTGFSTVASVVLWFAGVVLVGWLAGVFVVVADVVRPGMQGK